MEVAVAQACSRAGLAFFLPLIVSDAWQAEPLWPSYVFCRADPSKKKIVGANRRVVRVLVPPDENELLDHLRLFAPISRTVGPFLPGDDVRIVTGPFAGYAARVVGGSKSDLSLRIGVGRYPVQLTWSADGVVRLPNEARSLTLVPASDLPFADEEAETGDPEEAAPAARAPDGLLVQLDLLNEELVRWLRAHPEDLYTIQPRRFEELVAHLLSDMGYDVELTPQSRDGGRDVLAVFKLPAGEVLTLVECKRWAPDQKVGVDVVERFLWTIDRRDNASCGVIASTSYFTEGARRLENQYRWRLGLKDFHGLEGWLAGYGKWSVGAGAGLWLPTNSLALDSGAKHTR